jgi:hypothetical protein
MIQLIILSLFLPILYDKIVEQNIFESFILMLFSIFHVLILIYLNKIRILNNKLRKK